MPDPRPRRNRSTLESRVREAATSEALAVAHFELALFHDNNSREAEAIPHYEAALTHGLAGERRAECLAWLASSLYKTHHPDEALHRLTQSREATANPDLQAFLAGLERRVNTALARPSSS